MIKEKEKLKLTKNQNKKINTLLTKIENFKKENTRNENSKQEISDLKEKINTLLSKIENLKLSKNHYEVKIITLEKTITIWKERYNTHMHDCNINQEKYKIYENIDIEKLLNEKNDLERKLKMIKKDKEYLEEKLNETREKIINDEFVIKRLKKQKSELKKENLESLENLEDLKQKKINLNCSKNIQCNLSLENLLGQDTIDLHNMSIKSNLISSKFIQNEFPNFNNSKIVTVKSNLPPVLNYNNKNTVNTQTENFDHSENYKQNSDIILLNDQNNKNFNQNSENFKQSSNIYKQNQSENFKQNLQKVKRVSYYNTYNKNKVRSSRIYCGGEISPLSQKNKNFKKKNFYNTSRVIDKEERNSYIPLNKTRIVNNSQRSISNNLIEKKRKIRNSRVVYAYTNNNNSKSELNVSRENSKEKNLPDKNNFYTHQKNIYSKNTKKTENLFSNEENIYQTSKIKNIYYSKKNSPEKKQNEENIKQNNITNMTNTVPRNSYFKINLKNYHQKEDVNNMKETEGIIDFNKLGRTDFFDKKVNVFLNEERPKRSSKIFVNEFDKINKVNVFKEKKDKVFTNYEEVEKSGFRSSRVYAKEGEVTTKKRVVGYQYNEKKL